MCVYATCDSATGFSRCGVSQPRSLIGIYVMQRAIRPEGGLFGIAARAFVFLHAGAHRNRNRRPLAIPFRPTRNDGRRDRGRVAPVRCVPLFIARFKRRESEIRIVYYPRYSHIHHAKIRSNEIQSAGAGVRRRMACRAARGELVRGIKARATQRRPGPPRGRRGRWLGTSLIRPCVCCRRRNLVHRR